MYSLSTGQNILETTKKCHKNHTEDAINNKAMRYRPNCVTDLQEPRTHFPQAV